VSEERIHQTWLHSDRTIPKRFVRPLLRFTRIEASGGAVLLFAAAAALIWANAPFGHTYTEFWETPFDLTIGAFQLDLTLHEIVNDALMAIFFFVVGLEIKRELVLGDLSDPKAAALPALAALGGMAVPALIYLIFVSTGNLPSELHEATRGWGIPMATDIAFSVGVLSLLGKRVPVGAKLFLLALAIADDIGAIIVIALFYTEDLHLGFLALALAAFALVGIASRVGIRSFAVYAPLAFFSWFFLLESGVHATLAGVALALLTPARPLYSDAQFLQRTDRTMSRYERDSRASHGQERIDEHALTLSVVARESVSPLRRLEDALLPWSSFVVVPIFALANAGVRFAGTRFVDAATHPVALGVAVGLLVGKVAGISSFAWMAVRLRIGKLPRFTSWRHMMGLSALAGIGFTVSLFITNLAFEHPELTDRAKVGIFIGSTLAGIIGYLLLRLVGTGKKASGSAVEGQPAVSRQPEEPVQS
jgi:NhaA family Na+:H+ antiporter